MTHQKQPPFFQKSAVYLLALLAGTLLSVVVLLGHYDSYAAASKSGSYNFQITTITPTPYPTPAQAGTLISNSSGNADNFGYAVAVSGDTIVAGAPNHDYSGLTDAGAAYVYQFNGAIWAQQAELLASDAASQDMFGSTVGIYGDTIIVGAAGNDDAGDASGSAYIFTRSGTIWTQQPKLTAPDAAAGDQFGQTVAVSVDSVIVGANNEGDTDQGAAYVFTRSGATWSFQQKLVAGDPLDGAQFGYAVDLYGDTAVIGAPLPVSQIGAAYVFVRHKGVWSQQQKLTPAYGFAKAGDRFGGAVAVYNDAVAVGAPYTESGVPTVGDDGSIHVYYRQNSVWVYQPEYGFAVPSAVPSTEPQLGGYAVDVYRETYLAGVPYKRPFGSLQTGLAYVIGKTAFIRVDTLTATPAGDDGLFGWSVARDGSTVVIGAPNADYASLVNPGAAYIFRVVAPPWEPTASLTPLPSQTPPSPTAPANATPVRNFYTTDKPTLTWNRVSEAIGYEIEIDDAPDFGTLVDRHQGPPDTLSYTTVHLDNGGYYWRVHALLSGNKVGDWSRVQQFTVSAEP